MSGRQPGYGYPSLEIRSAEPPRPDPDTIARLADTLRRLVRYWPGFSPGRKAMIAAAQDPEQIGRLTNFPGEEIDEHGNSLKRMERGWLKPE
jgi:hypothetical protein